MSMVCTLCGEEKKGTYALVCRKCYLAEYYRKNKDRLQAIHKEYGKTHREEISIQKAGAYRANRKKIIARTAKYYADNKSACLERMSEYYIKNKKRINDRNRWYSRWYRIANHGKVLDKNRRYYAENSERITAAARIRAKANPEKGRENRRKYRARKRNATIEMVDEKKIYKLCGNRCSYCGSNKNLEIDHVVALAAGGSHCESNLLVACKKCNASKGKRPLAKWLATRPMTRASA